jgi:hypothetical protein
MKNSPIVIDKKATYLSLIESSVGSKLFRHLFCRVGGKKTDLLRDGDVSCAFFVSSILILMNLIKGVHVTVSSTVRDMEASGWVEVKKPKVGSVLLWGEREDHSGEYHKHLGFFMGEDKAISNVPAKKSPQIHHFTYGVKNGQPVRRIEKIFWHPSLGK